MDSMMPASVALNMPSTAAEVTVGSPHWPARGAEQIRTGDTPGPPTRCSPVPLWAPPAAPLPRRCCTISRARGYGGPRAPRGCRALTGVGDAEPGCRGQDLAPGVRPGLVPVLLGLAGEDSGAGQHVADQPHQHDGQDDLRATHRDVPASLPSPRVHKGGNLGPPQHALSQSLPGTF